MDKSQYSTALQNAVAFLKGQKKIRKDLEISAQTGFGKSAVSAYLTGSATPSKNFIARFQEVYGVNLEKFVDGVPVEVKDAPTKAMETAIRTESKADVLLSYVAEIYAHQRNLPAATVRADMEELVGKQALKELDDEALDREMDKVYK